MIRGMEPVAMMQSGLAIGAERMVFQFEEERKEVSAETFASDTLIPVQNLGTLKNPCGGRKETHAGCLGRVYRLFAPYGS